MKYRLAFVLCCALSLLAACGGGGGGGSSPAASTPDTRNPDTQDPPPVVAGDGEIRMLSNRADLISDGDALVEVLAQDPAQLQGARAQVGETDVTAMLTATDSGTLKGLISGLALGENTLTVTLADQSVLTRTIINHPNGGPVFSGPQIQPWHCTNEQAVDAQCNQPAHYSFKYVPADKLQSLISNFDPQNPGLPGAFQPYDPANPPAADSIATVTTDQGVTVPFIVRVETGVQNRDRYQIMTLFQPDAPWTALHPQAQWNHKLLIHHGGNVGVSYGMGNPPNGDLAGTAPDGAEFLLGDSISVALGRGFMTLSTAQGNLGHNENLVTAAESLMMAKERIIEQYGELRYTIGTGCSGGSITQQHVANAYPGIYQGLIVQCSYPDVWTTATQFADYHLLSHYFGNRIPESPEDMVDVFKSVFSSGVVPLVQWPAFYGHLPLNPIVSDVAFFPAAYPDQADCPGLEEGVPVYDADNQPDGLRCGLLDYMASQFGPRDPAVWSANEQLLSRSFTGIPLDNAGVQYGLGALQAGVITGDQFLAVNRNIGGLSVDIDFQPERTVADPQALSNAYRTGAINTAEHMANVPIIDLRGLDPGIAHDAYHSWQMRARLQKAQGYFDNQVIWYGAIPLAGDTTFATQALLVMDRWLSNVEADTSSASVAQKVVADKPVQARDRCLSVASLLDEGIVPFTGNILYPKPVVPGLDPTLLPSPPPEAGVVVDALTGQVCGLDISELPVASSLPVVGDLLGTVGDLLSPITDNLVDLQHLVVQTRFGTPRTVAGDSIDTLTNKCQLKAVDPADYPVNPLTGIIDSQAFADKVAEIFPNGVCDYSKPPVGQVPTRTWLQYGTAEQVIIGGEPLTGEAAGNSRQGWASPAFDTGL
ncbi:hypothetical protein A11A3_09445 [Alcanivorax hongdengensis A-11-3]|uniref:DUF6351 domain-containing protein n=1 Tax=Alcanivorax hongdengensis A-11-3 TaxID=1177179 RepID=L0WBQ6_9GAMM|nr:DUF6351 family protein [Alcanivorax hongdengensis]EKF74213.1 hypothetical protein A11A3_09445 [Alcanivorax hongdengensis A-11-3]